RLDEIAQVHTHIAGAAPTAHDNSSWAESADAVNDGANFLRTAEKARGSRRDFSNFPRHGGHGRVSNTSHGAKSPIAERRLPSCRAKICAASVALRPSPSRTAVLTSPSACSTKRVASSAEQLTISRTIRSARRFSLMLLARM